MVDEGSSIDEGSDVKVIGRRKGSRISQEVQLSIRKALIMLVIASQRFVLFSQLSVLPRVLPGLYSASFSISIPARYLFVCLFQRNVHVLQSVFSILFKLYINIQINECCLPKVGSLAFSILIPNIQATFCYLPTTSYLSICSMPFPKQSEVEWYKSKPFSLSKMLRTFSSFLDFNFRHPKAKDVEFSLCGQADDYTCIYLPNFSFAFVFWIL